MGSYSSYSSYVHFLFDSNVILHKFSSFPKKLFAPATRAITKQDIIEQAQPSQFGLIKEFPEKNKSISICFGIYHEIDDKYIHNDTGIFPVNNPIFLPRDWAIVQYCTSGA